METITNTMIEGLNQKMVQARLNSIDSRPFLFGRYFPLKRVYGLVFSMLTNQNEYGIVKGDVVSMDATNPRKKRPIHQRILGDIPKISISRQMKESEIMEYQTALALSPDADAVKLVNFWAGDIDFCFNGVQAELEYIAWALVSNAGKLSFTLSNNATFANDYDLDYQVDADQKKTTSSDWGSGSTADILGDLRTIIKGAKDKGLNPKYAFINLNTLYKICSADQIIKACASYIANAVNMAQTPDLTAVNQMLAKQSWLNGLQLIVIDHGVIHETFAGNRTTLNTFADDRMVIAESPILGSTQYNVLESKTPMELRAVRSHTVVRRYGISEPRTDVTIGESYAIPVLDSAYENIYLKTDGQAW